MKHMDQNHSVQTSDKTISSKVCFKEGCRIPCFCGCYSMYSKSVCKGKLDAWGDDNKPGHTDVMREENPAVSGNGT